MIKKWTDELNNEVYERLCDCRTIKADLPALVNAKWNAYKAQGKQERGFTKEDALIAILELLDCNGRYIDLTEDEYNELKEV